MTEASASPVALRALVADDERLLREQLKSRLSEVWPELQICGEARDGQEAVDKAEALRPDVVFLDIRMPGLTGLEAAREIVTLPSWSGEIVFVTAYDEYAVAAFEQGALDYLLKPVESERLAQTAQRVRARLQARPPRTGQADAPVDETALDTLLAKLLNAQQSMGRAAQHEPPMRWIQCTAGSTTKLIDVKDVLFFRSDEKYTRVQTRDQEAFMASRLGAVLADVGVPAPSQIIESDLVNYQTR